MRAAAGKVLYIGQRCEELIGLYDYNARQYARFWAGSYHSSFAYKDIRIPNIYPKTILRGTGANYFK